MVPRHLGVLMESALNHSNTVFIPFCSPTREVGVVDSDSILFVLDPKLARVSYPLIDTKIQGFSSELVDT